MELTANERFKTLSKSWDIQNNEAHEKPMLKYGNFLHLQSKSKHVGKIGEDLSIKLGKTAAREIAIDFIATINNEFGNLNKIKRVIGINGKLNCSADFNQHQHIVNACSELLNQIWGTKTNNLIATATTTDMWSETTSLEIEALFELDN